MQRFGPLLDGTTRENYVPIAIPEHERVLGQIVSWGSPVPGSGSSRRASWTCFSISQDTAATTLTGRTISSWAVLSPLLCIGVDQSSGFCFLVDRL